MNQKRQKLTFPISDTVSGPGTYEAEVILTDSKDDIPAVDAKEVIDEFGHGAAKDVASTSKAPEPFDK